MTKYVRLEKNTVLEILETEQDITEMFHPSIKWDVCTQANVQVGWVYSAGVYSPKQPSVEELSYEERTWRDAELIRADEELNKVQDSDPKSKGTVTQWRDYRRALRAIPDLEGFPVSHVRPVAPDAV